MMAEHFLDLLGYVCPVPLLKAQEKIRDMASGDVLVIETEHARAVRNILNWAWREGYPVDVNDEDRGLWRIRLEKR